MANSSTHCLNYLISKAVSLTAATLNGDFVLHLAAITKNVDVWKVLVDAGAKLTTKDRYGRSAIDICGEI